MISEESELLKWLLSVYFIEEDGCIVERCLNRDAGKLSPYMNARLVLWLYNNKGEGEE